MTYMSDAQGLRSEWVHNGDPLDHVTTREKDETDAHLWDRHFAELRVILDNPDFEPDEDTDLVTRKIT